MICRYLVASTAFFDCIALGFRVERFFGAKILRTGATARAATLSGDDCAREPPHFFVPQKWVSRSQSSPPLLPYVPSCPQWSLARKTVLPTEKLKGASQKGKKNLHLGTSK